MAEPGSQPPQELFKLWQNGDTTAGQKMAQRFTDWYYAVTAVQLGEVSGREPLQRACSTFAEGITTITRSSELVDWAHGIVAREVRSAGGRGDGGNFPNALTNGRSPTQLLQDARNALTSTQFELLAATFNAEVPLSDLITMSEAHGGWPLAILEARYVLKRALRDGSGVPFTVVPESPDLDRAPMPLYEAARMSGGDEEAFFEKWLLSNIDLCRDVAEFAAFSHALRAGAFRVAAPSTEPPPAPSEALTATAPAPSAERGPASHHEAEHPREQPPARLVLWSVVVVVLALVGILAVLYGFFA